MGDADEHQILMNKARIFQGRSETHCSNMLKNSAPYVYKKKRYIYCTVFFSSNKQSGYIWITYA